MTKPQSRRREEQEEGDRKDPSEEGEGGGGRERGGGPGGSSRGGGRGPRGRREEKEGRERRKSTTPTGFCHRSTMERWVGMAGQLNTGLSLIQRENPMKSMALNFFLMVGDDYFFTGVIVTITSPGG